MHKSWVLHMCLRNWVDRNPTSSVVVLQISRHKSSQHDNKKSSHCAPRPCNGANRLSDLLMTHLTQPPDQTLTRSACHVCSCRPPSCELACSISCSSFAMRSSPSPTTRLWSWSCMGLVGRDQSQFRDTYPATSRRPNY